MTLKKGAPLTMIKSDGIGTFDWKGRPATKANAQSVPILGTSVSYDSLSKAEKEDSPNLIAIPKNWSSTGRPTALPQKMAGIAGTVPNIINLLKSSIGTTLKNQDVWAGLYELPVGASNELEQITTDGFQGQVADNDDFPPFTLTTHWKTRASGTFTGQYIGRELLYIVGFNINIGENDVANHFQGAHETSYEINDKGSVGYILPRANVITHVIVDDDDNVTHTYDFEHNVTNFTEAISKDTAYYSSLSQYFQRFSLKCLCTVATNYPTEFLGVDDPRVATMFQGFTTSAKDALTSVFPEVEFVEYNSSSGGSDIVSTAAGIVSGWITAFFPSS
jgi:hypothetical protein